MAMSDTQSRILSYWKNIRSATGALPARRDFTLRNLGRHSACIAIVDIKDDPLDFEYRLLGTTVVDYLNGDHTGKRLSEFPDKGPGSLLWQVLCKMTKADNPELIEVPYTGPMEGRDVVTTLYLPLASDGKHPDKIMLIPDFAPRTGGIEIRRRPSLGDHA